MTHATRVTALLTSASLIAVGAASPAPAQQSAQADQPSASASSGLEEIVVTARRREEKAQNVPIAMSNFTAQSIENQKVVMLNDLSKDIPALTIAAAGTSVLFLWIRGVPGVVSYWNDSPVSLSGSAAYFDVSSVQVLKGPQGTLFGVATNGGAIVIQSKAPTNSFEGFVQAEAGDYGHRKLQGVINIPIIDDKFLLRIGGETNHTDGYLYDVAAKVWTNDVNYNNGRLYATIRPTENLQNDAIFNYYSQSDNNFLFGFAALNPDPNNGGLYYRLYPATAASQQRNLTALGPYAFTGVPLTPYRSNHQLNVVNTTRYDLTDNITIKNIVSYEEIQVGRAQNIPDNGLFFGTNAFGFYNGGVPTPASGPAVQYSEELQLLGKLFDEKLTYTVGTFNNWSGTRAPRAISPSISYGGTSLTQSAQDSRTNAVYGQGTYDLSDFVDGLSFTGGYRYTWDYRYAYTASYSPVVTPGNIAVGPIVGSLGVGAGFKAGTYTMSLDWQITPQTLIYVANSKGYSRGGFVLGLTIPKQYQVFQPETLNNVEVGIKSDWNLPYDMKARTNISAYYGFYDQVQVVQGYTAPGPTPGTIVTGSVTTNAGQAHIEGFDFQLTLIPVPEFEFGVSGAYNHPAYDIYVDPLTGTDWKDSSFTYAPKWKTSAQLTYHLPIDESLGRLAFNANWDFQSKFYDVGIYLPTHEGGIHNTVRPDNFVNLSLNWNDFLGRIGLDARAYVTNLTQQVYQNGGGGSFYSAGAQGEAHGDPREWGAAVKYSFGP